jgi:hypothetical protein
MPATFKLILDRRQCAAHPRSHRDSLQGESLGPRLAAHVREAQKVKRLALASAFSLSPGRAAATELKQASLLRMKMQAKLLKTLTECLQTSSCVCFMLEANHKVIRITNHDAIARRMSLSPLVDPQIESVVQEHVGQ